MKIDVKEIFNSLVDVGLQKKIPIENISLRMYCAVSNQGNYMLSVMSSKPAPNISSTKALKVSQIKENDHTYWINIELIEKNAFQVFLSLCDDLILAIDSIDNEEEALVQLANRFYFWRIMFKNPKSMTEEKIKGLYGELVFLNKYMIPKYGVEKAISSWSGPEMLNKDFSIEQDWYEIKTISVNNVSVKISSIAQLSSTKPGKLIVIKVEKMAEEFNDGLSSLQDLFDVIMNQIETNQYREIFIKKLLDYGFDISDNTLKYKLRIADLCVYNVNDDFPRILEKDIKHKEIQKISYELQLNSLEKFKIEG